MAANLPHYHRGHEKYYSEAPLADAIALQRAARTLIALAERWTAAEPAAAPAPSPLAGTPDLNDDCAIETSGVLFILRPGCAKTLASARFAPAYLFSGAELINRAADLSAASSVLTHENGRRWRIFEERIKQVTAPG